jgi:hypothetical protein
MLLVKSLIDCLLVELCWETREVENRLVYIHKFGANLDVGDVIKIMYHEYTWIRLGRNGLRVVPRAMVHTSRQ